MKDGAYHHGKPVRWDRRLSTCCCPKWDRAVMGQRDRSLSYRGHQDSLPQHASRRRYHEAGRREAPPCGHYLRRQPLSGSECGWRKSRLGGRAIRSVHGANTSNLSSGMDSSFPNNIAVRPVDIAVIELLDRLRAPAGGPGGQRRGVSGAVGSLSERALPPEPDPNRVTRGISAARRRKRRQGNPDRTLLTSCGLPHTGTYAAARSLLREGAQATTTPLALLSLRGDAAVTAVELPDNVEAQRAGNARHGEACQMVRGRHTRRGSGAGYGRRLLRTDSAPGHAPAPACCAPARERVCWTFVGQRALTWR